MRCDGTESNRKVAVVVGAGWSGLLSMRWLLREGIDVIAIEESDRIGGVWNHVPPGTTASSSKTYLHSSSLDFESDSDFPTADEVLKHLRRYAAKHELERHIRFNTRLESYRFDGRLREWTLRVAKHGEREGDEVLRSNFLVFARGLCGAPTVPEDLRTQLDAIGVPSVHSFNCRSPSAGGGDERRLDWLSADEAEREAGSAGRVLVVGGGESATDVASELADRGVRVILSLRTGRWFLPREKLSSSSAHRKEGSRPLPADVASRRTYFLMGFEFFRSLLDRWITGNLNGTGGHGIDAWAPSRGVSSWSCFLNKRSEDVLDHVRAGRIDAAAAITAITGDGAGSAVVEFAHAPEPKRIRGIVFATGFAPAGATQGSQVLDAPDQSLLHVFPTNSEDAFGTVAYVGAVRPALGSIPSVAEFSAAFAASVFSGRSSLPSVERARAEVRAQTALRMRSFPEDGLRYRTLVHTNVYADRVLEHMGCWIPVRGLPPLLDLVRTYGSVVEGMFAFWTLLMCPWSTLELEVHFSEPEAGRDALERIRASNRERKRRDSSFFVWDLLASSVGAEIIRGWRRIAVFARAARLF